MKLFIIIWQADNYIFRINFGLKIFFYFFNIAFDSNHYCSCLIKVQQKMALLCQELIF